MNKQEIIKNLAIKHGLKSEYIDSEGKLKHLSCSDYETFLNLLDVDTSSSEKLKNLLLEKEILHWQNKVDNVHILKENAFFSIKFRIHSSEIYSKFYWVFEEENKQLHSGEFIPLNLHLSDYKEVETDQIYYQFDLSLNIKPSIGYHKLNIIDSSGIETSVQFVVTPEKAYCPAKNKKSVFGPKFKFKNIIQPDLDFKFPDSEYLNMAINYVAQKKGGIVGIGPINHILPKLENTDVYLPSSRFLYNILYLNLDAICNFTNDLSLQSKTKVAEYYEVFKNTSNKLNISYKNIYNEKIKILKILYQSFSEKHLNPNTDLAKIFYKFTENKNDRYKKLSLFNAIEEYLNSDKNDFYSWQDWPSAYKNPCSEVVKQFKKTNIELIQFYQFCQWQCDIQLEKAGRISLDNNLTVGIYTELPLFVDSCGSDSWCDQDLYNLKAKIIRNYDYNNDKEAEEIIESSPISPCKLKENGYQYLIDYLRVNMVHTGAIKLLNLGGFYEQRWHYKNEHTENIFHVNYPFEEIMGIIALESHRNKCMIISDDKLYLPQKISQSVSRHGVCKESDLNIVTVSAFNEFKTYSEEEDSKKSPDSTKIPVATYRLQLNKDFTFNDARNLIPQLKTLGISHVYISPVLKARSESTHGYDIIDHNQFHESIGRKEDFDFLVDELHVNKMGIILDIVPNHMGINNENHWWMDVLENGPSSFYAPYFDIDWNPLKTKLKSKVLVPILGNHYGSILENSELDLKINKNNGKFFIHYYEHVFPINPSSYPTILGLRAEVLSSRLGQSNPDFFEYQSIITAFKNLPDINEHIAEKIYERHREKDITLNRLKNIIEKNEIIKLFVEENQNEFTGKSNDSIAIKRLHNLLEQQVYRLAYWKVSVDEINYRRFFDVNDLAAINVDNASVFTSTHNFILDMIGEGKVDGLRIDHPDGLLNPTKYFKTLQCEVAKRLHLNLNEKEDLKLGSEKLPLYIVAEKILAPFENLSTNWPIHGTVGYDFLNCVNGLFVDKNNEKKFIKLYNRFLGKMTNYDETVNACKILIMKLNLTGELNVLSNHLNRISESYFLTRDFTLNSIREALIEVIANFPVYRTYISQNENLPKCAEYTKWAVRSAKKKSKSTEPSIFDFIEKILLLEYEQDKNSELYTVILNFTQKFQQYTGPLMAKGLEDTAFYRYNRLISLNEVGGSPDCFGISSNYFHEKNIERLKKTPYSMLCTSSHDTKRSEDLRARISVLSEIPNEWQNTLLKWNNMNKSFKTKCENTLIPSKNDEYFFYQTLIGIWSQDNEDQMEDLTTRLEEYMIKSIREAKLNTSWININKDYENAMINFVRKIMNSYDKHIFWRDFLCFQKEIALRGSINSLSQTLLKLTAPGIPDIYQGNEILNFRLVDPDNRTPINHEKIKTKLDEIVGWGCLNDNSIKEKILDYKNNYAKLFLTYKILQYRNQNKEFFKKSEYLPLEITGKYSENIIAFARKNKENTCITIVPRLIYDKVSTENPIPFGSRVWGDTAIILKDELFNNEWVDIFSNQNYKISDAIKVSELFQSFPVSFLIKQSL
jgi:(1->4)-alpha-D-glucan 1-alpha-D-glucosylmutase